MAWVAGPRGVMAMLKCAVNSISTQTHTRVYETKIEILWQIPRRYPRTIYQLSDAWVKLSKRQDLFLLIFTSPRLTVFAFCFTHYSVFQYLCISVAVSVSVSVSLAFSQFGVGFNHFVTGQLSVTRCAVLRYLHCI